MNYNIHYFIVNFLEFDPHFTVLLDPISDEDEVDECGNKIENSGKNNSGNITTKIIGITVGCAVGVAAIMV